MAAGDSATGALDARNVRVAVTGAWFRAPLGADAPTSADDVLGPEWVNLGYVSEDGTTRTVDRSTEDIRAWQRAAKVRSVVTESGISYSFVLIETTLETVAMYNGIDAADIDEDGTYTVDPSSTGGRYQYVFVVFDGDYERLVWIPNGEVGEIGDQVFAGGEPIGFEVTLNAYASTELNGATEQVFDPSLATLVGPAVS